MYRWFAVFLWVFCCVTFLGCSQPKLPPARGGTQAQFDPFGSPPNLPLPTDLIRNRNTGLLQVPENTRASAAQKDFNAYLNTLNGYPTSVVPEVRFTGVIDAKSVTENSVRVLDLTDGGVKKVKGLKFEVTKIQQSGRAISLLKIHPTTPWVRGHTYAVYLLGGAAGIIDSQGKPLQRSDSFALTASTEPLCAWDATLQYNADRGECSKPQPGTEPSGCCTRTVSASLQNLAKRQVLADIGGVRPKAGTLEKEEARKMRQLGSTLEKLRQGYNKLLGASTFGDFSRSSVVMTWHFSITGMTEISFDPSMGVIPYPNNLLLDSKTKKVQIPATQGETATQKALRKGLNTLDGFTTQGSYYASYQGSLDKASVKLGESVWILNLNTGRAETQWKVEVVDTAPAIVATPTQPLKEKTTYAILLVSKYKKGSIQSQGGLKDTQGRRVTAAPFMALLRSKNKLIRGKTSLISSVDHETAQKSEAARLAHEALFLAIDGMKINRLDVVAAWTFTTQSITTPLVQLRALPWKMLGAQDQNKPRWKGVFDPTLTRFPTGVPKEGLGGWVPQGSFETWLALDEEGQGTFLTDPTKGKRISVSFMMTVPKTKSPDKGWPVVLYQHGLTRSQSDVLAIANTLGRVGIATIAFDTIYHGARSRCVEDKHCDEKGKTGSCNPKTGKCVKGILADLDKNNIPDASGVYFLNTNNPFAVRDNMRQHVIDAAALLRGIALQASLGLKDPKGSSNIVKLDPTKVYLVGHSLGAILGTLVLATDPLPRRGVLNVPGAPLVDIILTAPNFRSIRAKLLQSQGVKEGTLNYLRMVTTFKWILDPADPANFGSFAARGGLPDAVNNNKLLPQKKIMLMLAGQDKTIPVNLGRYLARILGVTERSLRQTTYTTQGHSYLLAPDPSGSIAVTITAQKQMATFLLTGKICRPNVDKQVCQ